jgi:hypothetical protein
MIIVVIVPSGNVLLTEARWGVGKRNALMTEEERDRLVALKKAKKN